MKKLKLLSLDFFLLIICTQFGLCQSKKEYRAEVARLNVVVAKLEGEVDILTQEINKLESFIAQKEQDHTLKREEIQSLNISLEKLRQKDASYKVEINQLNTVVDTLLQSHANKSAEIDRLLERVETDKKISQSQIDTLKLYINYLETTIEKHGITYKKLLREKNKANLAILEKDSIIAMNQKLTQQEIHLLKKDQKLEQLRMQDAILLVASMLSLVLVIVFIFYSYQLNKARKKLRTKNQQIEEKNIDLAEKNEEIVLQHSILQRERNKSDKLLLNILPEETARELKETGKATPKSYDMVSVLFTDFKGFTRIAEKLTPDEIVRELDQFFMAFDDIVEKYNLEKIKTIGDAYMCAGGLPQPNVTNAKDTILAGLEMQRLTAEINKAKKKNGEPLWELRLGIHTGNATTGVVGKQKFAYDIWGDTVNLASRMESSGVVGEVNISEDTYYFIKEEFDCESRGKIQAKNKGEVNMYLVRGLKTGQ